MPCPTLPPTTFTHGKNDPAFRTKLQIGATLANAATTAGVKFRAVVADCACGDHNTFRAELSDARLPFVMALKRGHGPGSTRTPSGPSMPLASWPGMALNRAATGSL
ncbi:transposase [Streptomyces sp. IB201691-2A2]|uniref:transposase n=1 Tax=Streptomyces sp. IB201691-2A2 TaxID=2561920 RepID=UPI0021B10353|nr:transposase [Streptomyces sp. IB201691-2A2]